MAQDLFEERFVAAADLGVRGVEPKLLELLAKVLDLGELLGVDLAGSLGRLAEVKDDPRRAYLAPAIECVPELLLGPRPVGTRWSAKAVAKDPDVDVVSRCLS